VINNVKHASRYDGVNGDGNVIYKTGVVLPKLTFIGTVKLHGTNASVVFKDGEIYTQSRMHVLIPPRDNHGFNAFIESNKDQWLSFFKELPQNNYVIFGEWCGGRISKGAAISKLSKRFVIFGVYIIKDDDTLEETPIYIKPNIDDVYNILDFKKYEIVVDFNNPALVQNDIIKLVEAVEDECPVAKHFEVSGIGEGIVWSAQYNDVVHKFKTKGAKHSASKVKKLASVDIEKIKTYTEFAQYAATENRVLQALENVKPSNSSYHDYKDTGEVIRWVFNDIIKEETDTMDGNKIEKKEVGKYLANVTRQVYFKILEETE